MRKLYILFTAVLLAFNSYGINQTVTITANAGSGSLRDAIDQATNGDTVFFASNLAGQTITVSSQLTIEDDIVIQGFEPGDTITISGGNSTRIFSVSAGASVVFNRLSITQGTTSSGGGIFNNGTTVVNYCRFISNTSAGSNIVHGGGAVYNNTTGNLTVNYSEFEDNLATPNSPTISTVKGGAIFNRGSNVSINYSSFYNNVVDHEPPVDPASYRDAKGGAIYSSAGYLQINSCTFSNNGSFANGSNSHALGGAIHNLDSLSISNSTFYNNSVSAGGNRLGGNLYHAGVRFTLYNTILAGGIAGGAGPDLLTTANSDVISLGYNLIEDSSASSLNFITGDLLATPLLEALAYNNGAFTKTHAFSCGSPGVDAGSNTNAPTTDQAGQPRIFGGTIDIGAFESQGGVSVTATVQNTEICNGQSTSVSASATGTVTYSWDNSLGAGQSQTVSPTATTTYTVTATDAGLGCTGTSSVTVTVHPVPTTPVITLSGSDLTTGSYFLYQWFLNGNVISGAGGQTFTPTQSGNYRVQAINSFFCSSALSAVYNYTIVGIQQPSGSAISIYPNPATDLLTIENSDFRSAIIIDATGRNIKSVTLISGANRLDVSDLPSGYYVLRLTDAGRMHNASFIKR